MLVCALTFLLVLFLVGDPLEEDCEGVLLTLVGLFLTTSSSSSELKTPFSETCSL